MSNRHHKRSCDIKQNHHLVYPSKHNKEYIEKVTRTEHFLLHNVFRHTIKISKGFLRSLQYYCIIHEKEAKELDILSDKLYTLSDK